MPRGASVIALFRVSRLRPTLRLLDSRVRIQVQVGSLVTGDLTAGLESGTVVERGAQRRRPAMTSRTRQTIPRRAQSENEMISVRDTLTVYYVYWSYTCTVYTGPRLS